MKISEALAISRSAGRTTNTLSKRAAIFTSLLGIFSAWVNSAYAGKPTGDNCGALSRKINRFVKARDCSGLMSVESELNRCQELAAQRRGEIADICNTKKFKLVHTEDGAAPQEAKIIPGDDSITIGVDATMTHRADIIIYVPVDYELDGSSSILGDELADPILGLVPFRFRINIQSKFDMPPEYKGDEAKFLRDWPNYKTLPPKIQQTVKFVAKFRRRSRPRTFNPSSVTPLKHDIVRIGMFEILR